jgi:hypothetical protein
LQFRMAPVCMIDQLWEVNVPGVPRWSPVVRKIAFDSVLRAHTAVSVIPADGGPARPLTDQASDNLVSQLVSRR